MKRTNDPIRRTLLGVALLVQAILGASLLLQDNRHSEGFVALVVVQAALVLVFLPLFLLRREGTDSAWIRLLAFIGMALGMPAVWRLAIRHFGT